ncbi:MAG: DUF1858 domain-containing protein [Planctomycetes bacterium]|nr:DUF1858 domain-containing protein [Planctomycetota bacterium]
MFTKTQTIPEVLQQYPQVRSVFDRYGLKGCGGPNGPQETLEFFAIVHKVSLKQLFAELESASTSKTKAEPYKESLGDILYKRFFRAALLVLLAAGASTGVLTITQVALRGSYTSTDLLPLVQAHANAQIFGWIGLFVMGFAYQGLPRFKYVSLWRPEIANVSLILMLCGVGLRLAGAIPFDAAPAFAVAGGIFEAAAIFTFAWVMLRTLGGGKVKDAWDKYIYFGLSAFVISGVLEPIITYEIWFAPNLNISIERTATYYAPFRDLQLFAFAGMMLFGVGQRVLPTAFGFRAVRPRVEFTAFVLAVAGLAIDVAGWFAYRATGDRSWAMASWAGTIGFFAAGLLLAFEMRGFGGGGPGRSKKFINASFYWLLAASVFWLAFPYFLSQTNAGFAHGAYGASRHCYAVGFLSMMILGVSAKVVPVLKGFDPAREPALWAPFILINAGNAFRVGSQPLADLNIQGVHWITAAGSALTAFGFFIWGIYMWRLIGRALSPTNEADSTAISADSIVAHVLDRHPETLEVFETFGFREIKNPILRNTIGRRTTLRVACSMKNINLEDFVRALLAQSAKK